MTRYEIAAKHSDGRTLLVAYSPRLSRIGLLKAMQGVGQQLIDRLATGEHDEIKFTASPRAHAETAGWWVGFTGRTQHDAKQLGELPYIGAKVAS